MHSVHSRIAAGYCFLLLLSASAALPAVPCSFGNANHMCIAQGDDNPTAEGPEVSDHFGESLTFGDFNGDGREDLVIGTPDEDFIGANAGQIDVYESQGMHFSRFQTTLRHTGMVGPDGNSETDDHLGQSFAVGDFDGDGFDDLAVAAPTEDQTVPLGTDCGEFGLCDDIGLVQLLWGDDLGLSNGDILVIDFIAAGLGGHEPTSFPMELGACLAAGDVNDDGIDDLAIGAPGTIFDQAENGAVSLLIGDADREIATGPGLVSRDSPERFDRVGKACAIGRFANLGTINFFRRSIAAGCPGCDPAGAGEAGLVIEDSGNSSEEIAQTLFGSAGSGNNDAFGSVFAVGDFDHDGFDDLAVGVPNKNDGGVDDSGRVYVAFGGNTGLLTGGFRILGLDSFPNVSLEENGQFGAALAVGDLDGDGTDDLAIGAPRKGTEDVGVVFVAYGKVGTTLLDIRTRFVITAASIGGVNQDNAHFGAALAAGDVNGDGTDELAIGAPDDNAGAVDSGRVYVTHIFDPSWIFGDGFDSEGVTIWSDSAP